MVYPFKIGKISAYAFFLSFLNFFLLILSRHMSYLSICLMMNKNE